MTAERARVRDADDAAERSPATAVGLETFDLTDESEIGHIRLADTADVVVIAPATANVIAKMAHGIADDLLTTVLLATRAPLVVAPAMNVHMWEHVATQANVRTLAERGARIVGPACGLARLRLRGRRTARRAGRDRRGPSRRALTPQDLAGERVVVSAGPTREAIDPVRYLTNHSSGKMGYAIAQIARRRGADVTLVTGPIALPRAAGRARRRGRQRGGDGSGRSAAAFARRDRARDGGRGGRLSAGGAARTKAEEVGGRAAARRSCGTRTSCRASAREGSAHGRRLRGRDARPRRRGAPEAPREGLDLIVANDVTAEGAGFGSDTNVVRLLDAAGLDEALPVLAEGRGRRAHPRLGRGAAPASGDGYAAEWAERADLGHDRLGHLALPLERAQLPRAAAFACASASRPVGSACWQALVAAVQHQILDRADAEPVEAVDVGLRQRVARAVAEAAAPSPATARAAAAPSPSRRCACSS